MSGNASGNDKSRPHTPTVELDARFDDPIDSDEITVFPADSGPSTTEWLTIDAAYALPIEKVR
jgi:hypothetical protein